MPTAHDAANVLVGTDVESRGWLRRLRADGAERRQAIDELRALLLKAARFEVQRRCRIMPHLRGDDYEDLAEQSANDALLAVLEKIDSYRGESRFTTWAYKFALLEAAVKVRRRAWQGREVPLVADRWSLVMDTGATPDEHADAAELLHVVGEAIERELSPRQRHILVATVLDGVPIDVLAERLHTTRGALYKNLHDARRKLRVFLARKGFLPGTEEVG
jgi:RNA polymerase sigma-70 factor (ECF subfamily)